VAADIQVFYPVNIEEVRALGFIIVPSMYFILRLFERALRQSPPADPGGGRDRGRGPLPAALHEEPAPLGRRGHHLGHGVAGRRGGLERVAHGNARVALGLGATAAPLYYSTRGVRKWLEENAPRNPASSRTGTT
jgi:hypothetical protein